MTEFPGRLDSADYVDAELGGPPTDPFDPTLAIAARGLLAEFNRAGVLASADVHVATRMAGLVGEPRETVRLALGLAVRALRTGSVCVDLAAVADQLGRREDTLQLRWPEPGPWLREVADSPLIAAGPTATARPGRLVGTQLYLEKYWQQERIVARAIDERIGTPLQARLDEPLLRRRLRSLLPREEESRQRLAAALAATTRSCVIAGGPGTGKTRTVARLLAVMIGQPGPPPRIALAAPTGKAAARLGAAVTAALAELDAADRAALAGLHPVTLHRLLGAQGLTRFRHGPDNHLAYDVVVVDETSMVSLSMMARLLSALAPQTRLVLVGDPDQLASVEAGAVLADIVARAAGQGREPAGPLRAVGGEDVDRLPPDERRLAGAAVVRLKHRFRFGEGGIARLADAIVAGDGESAVTLLRGGLPDLQWVELDGQPSQPDEAADLQQAVGDGRLAALRATAVAAAAEAFGQASGGDPAAAVRALTAHQVLCAHRRGPFGAGVWSDLIQRWLVRDVPGYSDDDPWYVARPVLVRANDPEAGVFNGDAGIVVSTPFGRRVAFPGADAPLLISPARLPMVETVHALTIHKSQGSQYRRVSLILPPPQSPLLSRELLYTAITRASDSVCVVASAASVRAAVERPVARASGLRVDTPHV